MSLNWTDSQLAIFEEIANPTNQELAIEAVAGSAKSSSLVEAVSRFKYSNPNSSIMYMVFGNLASKEARKEFATNALVTTLHAFAHKYIVKPYGLGEVKGFLTWRDIPKTVRRPFGKDNDILALVEDYCKSQFTTMDQYVDAVDDDDFQYSLIPAAKQILNLMATGRMPTTHSFYLKLFHILVIRGTIKLDHVDRLLIDEAQDMSAMALDIIEHIPATQKVLVGDQNQRIFSFMKLINGFDRFPNAKVLTLPKSFRVSSYYAPAIEAFLHKHLNPDTVFKGMDYPVDAKQVTTAYLTRTNSALIGKMIELNKSATPYHLATTTKIKQMFKLPLAVIYAKPGVQQRDPELKHFQEMVDEYGKLPKDLQEKYNLYQYLGNLDNIDYATIAAIKLVSQFGSDDIIEAYELAEKHKSTPCDLQLMTAHSSKGTTRDIVELDPDMDKSVRDALSKSFKGTPDDRRAELCLYFVATTRHRHTLIGANYLEEFMDD